MARELVTDGEVKVVKLIVEPNPSTFRCKNLHQSDRLDTKFSFRRTRPVFGLVDGRSLAALH